VSGSTRPARYAAGRPDLAGWHNLDKSTQSRDLGWQAAKDKGRSRETIEYNSIKP
jgi:hypothetical protein